MHTWPMLLAFIRQQEQEVRLAVRVGSHVYGTTHAESDEDFVVVLVGNQPRNLLFGPKINVTIQGETRFQESLDDQNLFALECLMAPTPCRLREGKPFKWSLHKSVLVEAVTERATSDFKKAIRTMEAEPAAARKRLFHALRVPTFAQQVLTCGRIEDFTAANGYYEEIMTDPSEDAEHYAETWGPHLDVLLRFTPSPR